MHMHMLIDNSALSHISEHLLFNKLESRLILDRRRIRDNTDEFLKNTSKGKNLTLNTSILMANFKIARQGVKEGAKCRGFKRDIEIRSFDHVTITRPPMRPSP